MEIIASSPRLSISSWSLRRALGNPRFYGPEDGTAIPVATHNCGTVDLLGLPAHVAAMGIGTLEITHFHLPARDNAYLRKLRAALRAADTQLFSLLVDAGDLSDPQHGARDEAWIAGWLPVAAELGAERVRVIAGRSQPSQDAFERSTAALGRLATEAAAHGIRLTTENWYGLLARPEHVWSLLLGLEGRVGLNLDFGNWEGPTKYADLAEIAPLAESCHAKGDVAAGQLDSADFAACLRLLDEANFGGPYTLIYGEDGRSHGEYEMVQEVLAERGPRQPITL